MIKAAIAVFRGELISVYRGIPNPEWNVQEIGKSVFAL
jgi:hypothetical protein